MLRRREEPALTCADAVTGAPVRRRHTGIRYERPHPGDLLHVDVKKLGRVPDGGGWRVHGRSEKVRGRGIGCVISVHHLDRERSLGALSGFRREFHRCLTRRADGLFELTDAVLCADGSVRTLVGLSLAPEHRRGHGGLYDAVNNGRIEIDRLRTALTGTPLPRAANGRLVLAVDVSPWLRPDGARPARTARSVTSTAVAGASTA
ncbi:transposase [Saccharothrix sp. BKS2]